MKTISINSKKREEFIDITQDLQGLIKQEKIKTGVCVVFCPHTTAGLTINENADPSVKKDIIAHLKQLVPESKPYAHLEGNSDSHIKSSLLGSSLNIIIEEGRLALGTWQGVYFCEFDGPRKREVYIQLTESQS